MKNFILILFSALVLIGCQVEAKFTALDVAPEFETDYKRFVDSVESKGLHLANLPLKIEAVDYLVTESGTPLNSIREGHTIKINTGLHGSRGDAAVEECLLFRELGKYYFKAIDNDIIFESGPMEGKPVYLINSVSIAYDGTDALDGYPLRRYYINHMFKHF